MRINYRKLERWNKKMKEIKLSVVKTFESGTSRRIRELRESVEEEKARMVKLTEDYFLDNLFEDNKNKEELAKYIADMEMCYFSYIHACEDLFDAEILSGR